MRRTDGTGRDFCDPTLPVTCLFNQPVDRPVDRRKLQHVDQILKKIKMKLREVHLDRFPAIVG